MFWIIFVLLITYLCWLPFCRNPLYQDQALHWYVGREWLAGRIPYRDNSLGMGPCFALIYAFGVRLTGKNEKLFNLYSASYVAVGNLFLFLSAREIFGPAPAFFASLLFAFYMFSPRLIADRFPPETYVTTFLIGSFYWMIHAFSTASMTDVILSGLIIGAATLTRQQAYLYLPLFVAALSWKLGPGAATLFAASFLAIHAAWMLYFHSKGALRLYLQSSIGTIFNTAFFGNAKGKGHPNVDPMKVQGEKMINLIINNSLSILPLYLLAFSYLVFRLVDDVSFEVLLVACALMTGFYLITIRHNFDSCYWLNTVPWASLLAGAALGQFVAESASPVPFSTYLAAVFLTGSILYIFAFDHKFYLAVDPEKRDRLVDPRKISHASWWPTFNRIGEYLQENTRPDDRLLVIGHAMRIHNRSDRKTFFRQLGFVPFKYTESSPEICEEFFQKIKTDFPEVIVLAGHMPAFPFNPEPYLKDMKKISETSGMIYLVRKVFDNFPIYFVDVEKSYIRAVVRGRFLNERLRREKENVSAATRIFEQDIRTQRPEKAVMNFIESLQQENRLEDLIFVVNEIFQTGRFSFKAREAGLLLLAAGEAHYHRNELQEAEQAFAEAVRIDPDGLDAYNNLGVVYFRQQKNDQARAVFESLLARDPGNVDARENLSRLEQAAPPRNMNPEPLTEVTG